MQVKRASDSDRGLGIISQCLVGRSAGVGRNNQPRGRAQYTANVALKINAKLGGALTKSLSVIFWCFFVLHCCCS